MTDCYFRGRSLGFRAAASSNITLPLLFLTLLATISALPARAQEQDSEETQPPPATVARVEERIEVEDSLPYLPASNTITAKLPIEQAHTPANVGAVDAALIDEQHARTLVDALQNVSGINVQTGSGVFDFFVMRGFDSLTSGLILLDGAPEPESSFYQLYDVERVEVFKGPAGFLYGSNPLAGVVNIVRKQPVPHRFATFGLEAGSFGTQEAQLDVNTSSGDGKASFRLNGLWRESDGYRDGRDQSVTALRPGFAWRPDDRQSMTVNLEVLSSDYTPDAGLPLFDGSLPDLPRGRSYASPLDESRQDITRVQFDYEIQISERLTLRDKLYSRGLDWQTRGTLISGVVDFGIGDPQVFRTLLELDDRQRFVGNQLELVMRTDRHHFLAGFELQRSTDDFTLDVGLLPTIGLFEPVETPGAEPVPIPGQASVGDSETTVLAPYLIDQIRVSDRFDILVGARFDSIDFDDAISGTSRSDSEVSPMAGFVFQATQGTSLYANAARSFAPASTRVVGEREPEKSQQYEVGVRQDFADGRMHGILAAFQLERDNIAIPDDNGFSQQAGDQRSQGFELEFGGQLTKSLNGSFAYAWTDAELTNFTELVFLPFPPFFLTLDRSGNAPAFAPEHLFNAWLSRRFDSGFGLAGGLRYVDSQFIAEDNSTEIDAYTLLNATVSWERAAWRLSLNLRNLADEEYETRGFGSFSVIPGEPFSASLRIEYRM